MKNVSLVLALVAVASFCSSADAQIKRYKSKGVGTYNPFNAEYDTYGRSNFGFIVGEGTAIPIPTANPFVSNWVTNGEVKETYIDGSEIFFTGGGTVEIIPLFGAWHTAVWTGEFVVTRGTGRFANAGPGSVNNKVVAVNLPFRLNPDGTPLPGDTWNFVFEVTGEIDLGGN